MLRKRARLHLEQLEDRCVPSVTVNSVSGSVYLTGTPNGELDINHTTGSLFQVIDNGHDVGAPVSILNNLSITLQHTSGNVAIDLSGGRIPGNLSIDLGSGYFGALTPGNYSVSIFDDSMTPTGRISGSVSIAHGNGQEWFNIGAKGTSTFTLAPILILGNLTVNASASTGSGQGDALNIAAGTTIEGSVSTTQVDELAIGDTVSGDPLTTIGQNLTINDAGSLHLLQAVVTAVVGQNLSVTGTSVDDSFALQEATTGGGLVKGSLNVNLGNGLANGDRILLGPNTVVMGSAILTAGNNLNATIGDQFMVLGSVLGNLTVNMGQTVNSLYFAPQNVGDPQPYVGKSMVVNAGNGTNNIGNVGTVGTAASEFAGTVVGNLSFNLGSGDNGSSMAPMIIVTSLGGTLVWRSGNGQDFVQLGDATGMVSGISTFFYNVNMLFGNDDDTVIMDQGSGGGWSGVVNGGGAVTTNTFTQLSGTPITPYSILNF